MKQWEEYETGVRTDARLIYGLNCLGKSSAFCVDISTPHPRAC